MRIGIEAQRIFRKKKHGMDYVVLQEIKELQEMDSINEYYVFVAPGEDCCLKSTDNVHIVETGFNFYPFWEQVTLPHIARKLKLDILHCTSNTAPLFCSIPLILTLHDIIYLESSDRFFTSLSAYQNLGNIYRKYVVPRVLKRCKRIITVSDFERQNIIFKLNIQQEKIVRIHNGFNKEFNSNPIPESYYKEYTGGDGYFFHFANTDPRKNTCRILNAFHKYQQLSVVKRAILLTGINKDQLDHIIASNHLEGISNKIILTDYIPGIHLPSIYQGAFALIFASLREGFGIPILESMACGTPVITSNVSSMPEIAGPDAILVNPEEPDEIAEMMLRLETDEDFYHRQKEVGLQRAKLFSWKNTATELLDLYKDVYRELKQSGK